METNTVGRPRIIDSPETMDNLVDTYILVCQDPDKPRAITLTGMVLALGLSSRESLDNYLKYPEFVDSVKRAKLLVEFEYENRLVTNSNATGSIFALKNFGWKDKQEVDTTLTADIGISVIKRQIVDPANNPNT